MCILLFPFFIALLFVSNTQSADDPNPSITEDDIYFSKLNPEIVEDVTIYARIYNSGGSTSAVVRFYEGEKRNLIGEDEVTASEESYTLAKVLWKPTYGIQNVFVSIEDTDPNDIDLSNNMANVTASFIRGVSALKLSFATATIEEGIERVIPISVSANRNLENVSLQVIYKGELNITFLLPPQNIGAGETTKFYMNIKVPELESDDASESRIILLQASNDEYESNIMELEIRIHPSVEQSMWWRTPAAAAAAGTVGIFTMIGSTEIGKYKFLTMAVPLYTKLNKEEILDHYTRGKIHGYILANPGDHYNSIKKALGISNGSFAYHLHVLEREGVIKSRRDGIYKRFYPPEMHVSSNKSELKEIQRLIIERINESPGMSQTDIASSLGVACSTIHYHVKGLISADLVKARRIGRSVRYFPNDGINRESYS
jgi:predicted transcriptional regulator